MSKPDEQNPITELTLVVDDTNDLAINEASLNAAVALLKPIAETIPAALAYADSVTVTNAAEAEAAADARDKMLADAKAAKETINEFNGGIINKLFLLHLKWTAFRGLFDPLETAAKKTKAAIIKWQEDEERKARAEEARLQAEADERARKERERLEAQAAKLKTPEKQAERLEAAAAVVAPVVRVERPQTTVSVQKRWVVAAIDTPAFLAAAAADQAGTMIGFIEVKENALARAKAANPAMNLPGVTFEQRAV
jgi:hypothetical protein